MTEFAADSNKSHTSPRGARLSLGSMRKDASGAIDAPTSGRRLPIGLSSAAQLLGEVAVGLIAGAPGVLVYRSVVVTAALQLAATLHSVGKSAS